jgi:hypothetical protein
MGGEGLRDLRSERPYAKMILLQFGSLVEVSEKWVLPTFLHVSRRVLHGNANGRGLS